MRSRRRPGVRVPEAAIGAAEGRMTVLRLAVACVRRRKCNRMHNSRDLTATVAKLGGAIFLHLVMEGIHFPLTMQSIRRTGR